jgi:LDH2 family malate/lactate/ureidoglycolate dehydrogenase
MDEVPIQYYSRETLVSFTQAYLRALGATEEEAAITTDGIVTAVARWHPGKGQGLEKLFRLTAQTSNGGIICGAPFEILTETPAVAHVDAHKGFGYVTGYRSMSLALQKAGAVGVGCVVARHSNHYGQAGYHAERAAKAGMIGIVMTNALAEIAPWGAKTAVAGTNPWGMAVPRDAGFPILLDMALSTSGQGMVKWAHREGLPIPDNWALTRDGRRSTDPADFIAEDGQTFVGTQYPIGEFKGFGLSMFTDIIVGVMSGSLFGTECFTDLANNDVGHFFMALNPDIFMPHIQFQARLEQFIAEIKAAEPIEPGGHIYLPGEQEYLRERERLAGAGIPVDLVTVQKLREMAKVQEVPCPL